MQERMRSDVPRNVAGIQKGARVPAVGDSVQNKNEPQCNSPVAQENLRYAVSLVECNVGPGQGGVGPDRWYTQRYCANGVVSAGCYWGGHATQFALCIVFWRGQCIRLLDFNDARAINPFFKVYVYTAVVFHRVHITTVVYKNGVPVIDHGELQVITAAIHPCQGD